MTPAKSPKVAHRVIEGEGFIVDSRTGTLHHLNPIAAEIWGWIDGRRSEEDLAELLRGRYEVDRETADADVRGLLGELAAKGAVTEAGDALR